MDFSQASSDRELRRDGIDDEEDEEEDQIFSCRIENAKIMTEILTAIHAGGKDTHVCEVKASARAVVFSVLGRGKSTQARATLQAGLFDEFIFESEGRGGDSDSLLGTGAESVMHFSINLTTLLDCLLLFGSTSESTAAPLTYSVHAATACLPASRHKHPADTDRHKLTLTSYSSTDFLTTLLHHLTPPPHTRQPPHPT